MLARELVSILEENIPDYSRQTLLQEINFVQRIIFSSTNMYTLATDPISGLDPKVTPTTEEYQITGALRIDRVYKENFNLPLQVRIIDDTIYFQPTQLGQEYNVRYYTKPTELTSESIALLVPDAYIDVLEAGVEARLREKEHGGREGWIYWKTREMPKLQRKLNSNYRWGKPDGTKTIPTAYGAVRQSSYCS